MTETQSRATISGSYQEYRDGERQGWLVYFRQSDGGRACSKRPKQRNDCTVRAVALACDVPYDRAYDALATAGRKCERGFHFTFWAHSSAPQATLGKALRWIPFQAVKGESRMNPAKFCGQYPDGRWIIRTAKHVIAVVDGVVLDTNSPRPDRCVYGAVARRVAPRLRPASGPHAPEARGSDRRERR